MFCVYRIYNIISNSFYVGSTNGIKRRRSYHLGRLRRNVHENSRLQNAWNKYGEEAFVIIIENTYDTEQEMYAAEQRWLDQFYRKECCYNASPIANKPPSAKGLKRSKETLIRMSKARKGKYAGENHWCYGRTGSDHPAYGHQPSIQRRKQISQRMKGKRNPNYKGQYLELINEEGKEYSGYGIFPVAKELGINPKYLWDVVNGRQKSTGGWRLK